MAPFSTHPMMKLHGSVGHVTTIRPTSSGRQKGFRTNFQRGKHTMVDGKRGGKGRGHPNSQGKASLTKVKFFAHHIPNGTNRFSTKKTRTHAQPHTHTQRERRKYTGTPHKTTDNHSSRKRAATITIHRNTYSRKNPCSVKNSSFHREKVSNLLIGGHIKVLFQIVLVQHQLQDLQISGVGTLQAVRGHVSASSRAHSPDFDSRALKMPKKSVKGDEETRT